MKITAYIKTKGNLEKFFEKHETLEFWVLGFIITHIVIWFFTLSTNVIFWRWFELNTYLLMERITLVCSLLLGIFTYWVIKE